MRRARPNSAGLTWRIAPWLGMAVLVALWPRPARQPAGLSAAPGAPLEAGRGRHAARPTEIPPVGWKDVLWRTWREYQADAIPSVANGVAFCGIMALFPALAAFVSLYGLFADVATARDHLALLAGFVPADVLTFIGEQLVRIATQKQATLSFTFLFSLALSLWSANAGMKALFNGLNIAYDETEKRNFLKLNLISLGFTFGALLFMALTGAAVVITPLLLNLLHIDRDLVPFTMLRWPLLLVVTMAALAVVYRFGPSRERARWRWVSVGSVAASLLWLAGSVLFSWYVANFANYNTTYGSLGAVFGFLTWIWLSSVIVLLGAELNAEIEHQTAADSTTGPPAPLGARGAIMADTIGQAKHGGAVEMLPGFVARRLSSSAKRGRGES
jgi:membrane protein